jgi:hypothetical protein
MDTGNGQSSQARALSPLWFKNPYPQHFSSSIAPHRHLRCRQLLQVAPVVFYSGLLPSDGEREEWLVLVEYPSQHSSPSQMNLLAGQRQRRFLNQQRRALLRLAYKRPVLQR